MHQVQYTFKGISSLAANDDNTIPASNALNTSNGMAMLLRPAIKFYLHLYQSVETTYLKLQNKHQKVYSQPCMIWRRIAHWDTPKTHVENWEASMMNSVLTEMPGIVAIGKCLARRGWAGCCSVSKKDRNKYKFEGFMGSHFLPCFLRSRCKAVSSASRILPRNLSYCITNITEDVDSNTQKSSPRCDFKLTLKFGGVGQDMHTYNASRQTQHPH